MDEGKFGLLCELLDKAATSEPSPVNLPSAFQFTDDLTKQPTAFYDGVRAGWAEGLHYAKRMVQEHFKTGGE